MGDGEPLRSGPKEKVSKVKTAGTRKETGRQADRQGVFNWIGRWLIRK
jgi:hypothetical protein